MFHVEQVSRLTLVMPDQKMTVMPDLKMTVMPDLIGHLSPLPVMPLHIRYGNPHLPPRKNSVKGLPQKTDRLLVPGLQ